MIDLEKVLLLAKESAFMAGEEIMDLREGGFDVSFKGSKREIVTTADIKADEILKSRLTEALPEAGWLSEETYNDSARSDKDFLWLVDSLDGTKYFVMGDDQFTVSIGLTYKGNSILGVIYQPTKKSMFHAIKDGGAYLDNDRIHVSNTVDLERAILITSDGTRSRNGYTEVFGTVTYEKELKVGGTALRLAKLAKGEADIHLSMGNCGWGIAAGDILVREAGGDVTDMEGNLLTYNKPDVYVVPMIASNGILHDKIQGYKPIHQ